MNKINFNWKYCLIGLVLAAVCACSENDDLTQIAINQNQQEGTRTANWYTKEVTLEEIGTLESKIIQAMDGEEPDKLEKLIVSGPMGAKDFNYLLRYSGAFSRNIKSIDLRNVQIKSSTTKFIIDYRNEVYLQDDVICDEMFWNTRFKEIILPESVQFIGRLAFYSSDSLEIVVLPENVKLLPDKTFAWCRSLKSVTMPSNLATIGSYAFHYCESLKSIIIPTSVDSIGKGAFSGCGIETVVLPSNLERIEESVFSGCDSLESIEIPNSVNFIGNNAFYNCKFLQSITLPSNIESIESYAFNACGNLKSIKIPAKVKYLGDYAFYDCISLSSVEFSSPSALDSIAFGAFQNTNLKSIIIPNSVKYIGGYAFNECDSLRNLVLPSELKGIEDSSFRRCKSLESVIVPDKVKYLGYDSFIDCYSLSNVEFSSASELDSIAQGVFAHTSIDDSFKIPNGVKYIGPYAFYNCDQLNQLSIHENVTSVHDDFVSDCDNLQAVYWSSSGDVPYSWSPNGVFLYIDTDQDISVNDCWNNVIRNGVAEKPIIIQARDNRFFNIPREFIASEVTYTRDFWDETVPGGSSGWQTIVLPFTPDSILHESKGLIAPFGSDVEDAKPFWLRELTSEGFMDVTTISKDKAYIIAMPNHGDYLDEYRLNGTITFKGTNVTLAKTPDELEPSYGPDFDFYPTYNYVKKALRIYALHSKHGNYDNMWYDKSFFTRSAGDISPFNAYVTAKGGGRSSRAEFDLDTRSKATRGVPYKPNTSGIPQIGDM